MVDGKDGEGEEGEDGSVFDGEEVVDILAALSKAKPKTVVEISEEINEDHMTVRKGLKRLEARGKVRLVHQNGEPAWIRDDT